MGNDTDDSPQFASPPCFLHEVDPAYSGIWPDDDKQKSEGPLAVTNLSDAMLSQLGKAVLYGLPDAVIYSDADGIIQHWNAGAVRIFGFTEAEAIGQSLDIIIPERLRERHWAGYRQTMATGKSSHPPEELLSVPAVTKAGDRLSIQFTVAAVTGDDRKVVGIVALLRDATDTFAELKRLRQEARG